MESKCGSNWRGSIETSIMQSESSWVIMFNHVAQIGSGPLRCHLCRSNHCGSTHHCIMWVTFSCPSGQICRDLLKPILSWNCIEQTNAVQCGSNRYGITCQLNIVQSCGPNRHCSIMWPKSFWYGSIMWAILVWANHVGQIRRGQYHAGQIGMGQSCEKKNVWVNYMGQIGMGQSCGPNW